MDTTLGRRVAAAVRSSSNFSGGGGNCNINLSVSSGSHNPAASGSVPIGSSTTATSGVGSGSLSSSSTATGPRLRRQRSYEWRERQYSTSEDENVVTTAGGTGLLHVGNTRTSNVSLQSTGGGSSGKQRASPTTAVYAAGIASLLAGYSSKYTSLLLKLFILCRLCHNWKKRSSETVFNVFYVCVCETWDLKIREEYRSRVLRGEITRKTLEPKIDRIMEKN